MVLLYRNWNANPQLLISQVKTKSQVISSTKEIGSPLIMVIQPYFLKNRNCVSVSNEDWESVEQSDSLCAWRWPQASVLGCCPELLSADLNDSSKGGITSPAVFSFPLQTFSCFSSPIHYNIWIGRDQSVFSPSITLTVVYCTKRCQEVEWTPDLRGE